MKAGNMNATPAPQPTVATVIAQAERVGKMLAKAPPGETVMAPFAGQLILDLIGCCKQLGGGMDAAIEGLELIDAPEGCSTEAQMREIARMTLGEIRGVKKGEV